MFEVFISVGSNLGNRTQNCLNALDLLSSFTVIKAVSSFYETEPVGVKDQENFINAVAKVSTLLSPLNLLNFLKGIEKQMGRVSSEKWGPRMIDLDILFYEDFVLNSQELTIPHPELHKRRFVLLPLSELEPKFIHPVLEKSILEILETLNDGHRVVKVGQFYTVN